MLQRVAPSSCCNRDDHVNMCICRNRCDVKVQQLEKEVTEANEEIRRLRQQLTKARDDIATLTQKVKDVSTESSRYQKQAEECKVCFSNIEKSDKNVQFYTGLPSASVFMNCWIM